MSKAKDTIEKIRQQVFERKKEEAVQEAKAVIEKTMPYTAYDVIQDPNVKGRAFLIVKFKYDLATRQAIIDEVRPFEDNSVGLSMQMDKDNREYMFNRNIKEKK